MSQIRRQSIIATLIIFFGFFIGIINNALYTNKSWFAENQFSLTTVVSTFGQVVFAFATLGINSVIYKFFPYYKAHLKDNENDIVGVSVLVSTLFFVVVCIIGYFLHPVFERKFIEKSPEIVKYYFWLYPYAYFLIVYSILESYCWCIRESIITNFLREVNIRLLTMVLIILFIFKIVAIETLVKIFACLYFVNVVILTYYLVSRKKLYFVFKPSIVTKKFLKKIIVFSSFIYAGTTITTISSYFDSITISSKISQLGLAVFTIATFISNIIQVPQRSIIAVAIPELASAWREKNMALIQRIYSRSSINLLLVSLFLYFSILLTYDDIILFLNMKPSYLDGKIVFIFLGIKTIIDMGTGVNGQIIGTSNYWRFEFGTGVLLLALIIPLNYFLITKFGLMGAGMANAIAYFMYNLIRVLFLWYKFKMQPFSINTLYALLFAGASFVIIYFTTLQITGFIGILVKGLGFSLLFLPLVYYKKLSPDVAPVLATIKKRLLRK